MQIICTCICLVWLGAWLGIPYAFGVTWPWHYGKLTGPALLLPIYVPMTWWLDRRGYYDSDRVRRSYEDE